MAWNRISPTVVVEYVISALKFVVSECGGVVEIIYSSYQNPYNRGAVLPRGRNVQDMMPMPRSYHHYQPSRQYGYRRHQMSTYGNQPQRYPHQVGALPDHMWIYPRWYKIPKTQVDVVE